MTQMSPKQRGLLLHLVRNNDRVVLGIAGTAFVLASNMQAVDQRCVQALQRRGYLSRTIGLLLPMDDATEGYGSPTPEGRKAVERMKRKTLQQWGHIAKRHPARSYQPLETETLELSEVGDVVPVVRAGAE